MRAGGQDSLGEKCVDKVLRNVVWSALENSKEGRMKPQIVFKYNDVSPGLLPVCSLMSIKLDFMVTLMAPSDDLTA